MAARGDRRANGVAEFSVLHATFVVGLIDLTRCREPPSWAQVVRVYSFALGYLVMFPVPSGTAANRSGSTLGHALKEVPMTLIAADTCAPLGWLLWARCRAAPDAMNVRPRTR
jgi:hypothetical protein